MATVLVTGGAGYIGSHIIKMLHRKGYSIVVLDNLSKGHRDAVLHGEFIQGDIGDHSLVRDIIDSYSPAAVMHFAAFIEVGESVKEPLRYYRNNTVKAMALIETLVKSRVNKFIFSSTAAVYGMPGVDLIDETAPLNPINPYGASKRFVEQVLEDLSARGSMEHVSLRYFNASGADPGLEIGERHDPETHLIPLVLDAAAGTREDIKIFGTDYPTPDGTCVRDYIHVNDLALAHVLALEYLLGGGKSDSFNLGYGRGYSVREIIDTARAVTGRDIRVIETQRREGDPPCLVADSAKIKKVLRWVPCHDDIGHIIRTAWDFKRKSLTRQGGPRQSGKAFP